MRRSRSGSWSSARRTRRRELSAVTASSGGGGGSESDHSLLAGVSRRRRLLRVVFTFRKRFIATLINQASGASGNDPLRYSLTNASCTTSAARSGSPDRRSRYRQSRGKCASKSSTNLSWNDGTLSGSAQAPSRRRANSPAGALPWHGTDSGPSTQASTYRNRKPCRFVTNREGLDQNPQSRPMTRGAVGRISIPVSSPVEEFLA